MAIKRFYDDFELPDPDIIRQYENSICWEDGNGNISGTAPTATDLHNWRATMRMHNPSVQNMIKRWENELIREQMVTPTVVDIRGSREILDDPDTSFTEIDTLAGGHVTFNGEDHVVEKAFTSGNDDLLLKLDNGKCYHYTGLVPVSINTGGDSNGTT